MVYLIKNKIFSSNTYLLSDIDEKNCLIIDPGLDTLLIDNRIQELNLTPVAILSTHGHFDHIGSAAFFNDKFNIPFFLHETDKKLCQSANFYLKMVNLNHKIKTPVPDFMFKGEHEYLSVNGFNLRIHNFPGHSFGSCIIEYDNFLFSGDIIYKNGLGLDSIPRENKLLLRQSILNIFKTFTNEALVLPGHGESEYLGAIKDNNIELKKFLS